MTKLPVYCPICGKESKRKTTWTKNNYGKRYNYIVYIHKEDGTRHYMQRNRGPKRGYKTRNYDSRSVFEILREVAFALPFDNEFGFALLKKKVEELKSVAVNSETFSRALARAVSDSVLLKRGSGRTSVYLRRPVIENEGNLTVKDLEVTVTLESGTRTLQMLMYIINEGENPISKVLIQGTIGKKGTFSKDQLIYLCDRDGLIKFGNIETVLTYGNSIMFTVQLNDAVRKDESNYLLLISKIDPETEDFKLIMPERVNELSVRLLSKNAGSYTEERPPIRMVLQDGSLVNFPSVNFRKLRNSVISVSTKYTGLNKGEGVYCSFDIK